MMRVRLVTCLLSCLLVVGSSMVAAAQDEGSGAGSTYERYEVPETDIAIAFPSDWTVDLGAQEGEFEFPGEDGASSTVVMRTVVSTSPPAPPGCYVYVFDDMFLELLASRHAKLYARWFEAIEGATVDVRGVDLPIGAAARVDLHDPEAGLYWAYYLFDVGLDRYELACYAEGPSEDQWRSIADTIESTRDEPVEESEPAQRIELEEAGVAITFPGGWQVETESEVSEYQLPLEYADQETLEIRTATSQDLAIGWHPDAVLHSCGLDMYEDMPMSPARHAEETVRRFSFEEDLQVATIPVELSAGDAVRVDFEFGESLYSEYAFDANGRRFTLTCSALLRPDDDWLSIADSIEVLDGAIPIEPTAGQRVEVPGTVIALTFPSDWRIESQDEVGEVALPDEYAWAAPLMKRQQLRAYSGGLAGCLTFSYDAAIPLDELVDLMAARLDAPDEGWTAAAIPDRLPAGDAFRLDVVNEAEQVYYTSYFLEAGGSHHELMCLDGAPAEDDWLSLAETIEVIDAPPPAPVASEHSVTDFSSYVLVADGDSLDGSVMSADCTLATWIAYEDGSYEERLECTLSDDPVEPPEWQGTRPAAAVTISGGECEWTSDFWFATDGSDVWASTYEFTITPDGQVVGRTTYGSELLDCSGD